jgi:acetyl esterase/lipase
LFYLHGGGFVFGVTPQHLPLAAYLGQHLSARVLMVDYRLAPQFPFPAALDDCVAAYNWMLKQGLEARNIVIAGDSAGGNLALAAMMKLRDEGIKLPAAAAGLSPVTNLAEKRSDNEDFMDPLLPKKAMKFYTESYVGDHDPHDPLISPVYGDLRGLPPMLVHVGEEEILRNDAIQVVKRASDCGVDARLEIYPRMWHVWQLFMEMPQSKQSLDEIAQFLLLFLNENL